MVVGSAVSLLGNQSISGGQSFTVVIDPDTAVEEIVDVTVVSGDTLTITRGIDNAGSGQQHSAGAVIRHMAIGRDYREANLHIEASAAYNDGTSTHALHGIASDEGDVVGTGKSQTLTNKTLTSPIITSPTITAGAGAEFTSITFEGATADAFETTLTVTDPTQDNTITLPNTTGTVVIVNATQTLTNKTLTSPTISGTPVITGLSSAGMVDSSATPRDYVDAFFGPLTAAQTSATSAAASATAAATSATSAAASVTAAATSATSAANSATAAATSASSASTSQTAAATSATSAAASATAAATSATSAAASATAAAGSVSSVAASATAAATSATSAAASATAAATSATSASNSATASASSASAAATSASSAASSATDAATTYDNFDDRYLGSKSSAPSVDNDGNTLLVGAIYWNSALNNMYVWSGSTWVQIATTSVYTAPTIGSTGIPSGTTVTTIAGLTLSGGLVSADPTTALGIASKQYVDAFVGAINYHAPVRIATFTDIGGTYNNGTSGVGATITATSNGAIGVYDGVTLALNDRILVEAQTTQTQNGIYTVTALGSISAPWVLTRATDADGSVSGEMANGDVIFCTGGTTNAGKTFVNSSTEPIVFGTSNITYSEFSTALPTQTGNSGKYLTTDGTTPSWAIVDTQSVEVMTLMGAYI